MSPTTLGKAAVCVAVFVAALGLVTWRQSRAFEVNAELAELRRESSIALAERISLEREIQVLESRTRIVPVAAGLGLRMPDVSEQVFLPVEVTP